MGFIGGQIFPCMFIGTCAGAVAHLVTDIPIIVTVPCFMVGVPGAFCPIPFTLVGIAMLALVLGSDTTTCVFTTAMVSFMTACGTGVLQRMVRRGAERQAKLDRQHEENETEREVHMQTRMEELEQENKLLRKLSSAVQGISADDINGLLRGFDENGGMRDSDVSSINGVTNGGIPGKPIKPSPYLN